jgi:hypothetical protein
LYALVNRKLTEQVGCRLWFRTFFTQSSTESASRRVATVSALSTGMVTHGIRISAMVCWFPRVPIIDMATFPFINATRPHMGLFSTFADH